jgi:hypothetical protein
MVNWLRLNSFDVVDIHHLRAAKLSLNLKDPESRHCRCHGDDFFQNAVIVPFQVVSTYSQRAQQETDNFLVIPPVFTAK